MPELRTARENARLEIGSQRGRNSHQIGVLGIYDLQGLSYGRTELLVADMRLLEPDPGGSPTATLLIAAASVSGSGAGSDAWLSEDAACDRCIVFRRRAKCAADFFANVCSLIGRAVAAAAVPDY